MIPYSFRTTFFNNKYPSNFVHYTRRREMSGHSDVAGARFFPEQFGVSLEEQNRYYQALEEQHELESEEEQKVTEIIIRTG